MYRRHMKALWLRNARHGPDPTNEHLKLYKFPVPDPPWRNLATPTIIIHGAEDHNVSVDKLLEQTASFKDRKVRILPGVGHRLIHVAMGEVLRIIQQHWQATDS